jgi:tetratricopeptide (TPR) repeat protein
MSIISLKIKYYRDEKLLGKKAPTYLLLFLFLSLLGGVFLTQIYSDMSSPKMSRAESFISLPKGELLKIMSLGYSAVLSDLLWLEVVQALGEKQQTSKGFEWIYYATDVVTTLDPKFEYSYQIVGVALASLGKQYGLSNQILLKGIKNSPEDWRIPFYLGFNYFYYLKDYEKASLYISRAATLPGHSPYLPSLAARLYVEAKNPDLAIDFLKELYRQSGDENTRRQIDNKIREVIVERDILVLNKTIEIYRQKIKENPRDLNDLKEKNFIGEIPNEPFGGNYFFDAKNGVAQSSTHPERFRLIHSR